MCKCETVTREDLEKSHTAVAKTISNLGSETNKRLEKLEKAQKETQKTLEKISVVLLSIATKS